MEQAWLLLRLGQRFGDPFAGDIVRTCGKGLAVSRWREVAVKGVMVAGARLLQLVSLHRWVVILAELIICSRSLQIYGCESWSCACSFSGEREVCGTYPSIAVK